MRRPVAVDGRVAAAVDDAAAVGVILSQSPWRQTPRVGVEVAGEVALVVLVAPEVQRHRRDAARVQTSSPTSPMTGWPCSFQASTAQPSRRHCISPGTCGSSRLPPTKAPAKSVPPDMLHHQMSRRARSSSQLLRCPSAAPLRSAASRWCPARARSRRSPQRCKIEPAFMQLAKNAAPAPKKVTPSVGGEAPEHAPVRLVLACRRDCRRRCSRSCR